MKNGLEARALGDTEPWVTRGPCGLQGQEDAGSTCGQHWCHLSGSFGPWPAGGSPVTRQRSGLVLLEAVTCVQHGWEPCRNLTSAPPAGSWQLHSPGQLPRVGLVPGNRRAEGTPSPGMRVALPPPSLCGLVLGEVQAPSPWVWAGPAQRRSSLLGRCVTSSNQGCDNSRPDPGNSGP